MSYRIGTEEYYQRFLDLQEKLRRSEEERIKLEIRLNKMMQVIQTEEQRHFDNLSMQYKQFWDEDKRRQDRNNYILRILDRVENQSEALEEKARRFSLIRDQYYGMPKRYYEPNYTQSLCDNESCNLSPDRYPYIDMKDYNMDKNLRLQHQEKMEYLNKYLANIDVNKNKVGDEFTKSPRSERSSKSPSYVKNVNPKSEDINPANDLGYKMENFLTNRYSYKSYNDPDSAHSSPNISPCRDRHRSRSKSPRAPTQYEKFEHKYDKNFYPEINDHNIDSNRLSRFPRRVNRRTKPAPKKLFSADYTNSIKKLQKIQENSRKILSQHLPKPNSPSLSPYRHHNETSYNRTPILPHYNDPIWNYPVASDFGLNMNDLYQPDKVIQKYLIEKYNSYVSNRHLHTPYDFYHDRMIHDNFQPRPYHRYDYIRNMPDRYGTTSNAPNDYYMFPKSPRTYDGLHFSGNNDVKPTFKKYDDNQYKVPVSNYYSDSEKALNNNDDLPREEKSHGIHFNDNDEILEYDRNKPSKEYSKKYELNKNWKDDDNYPTISKDSKYETNNDLRDNSGESKDKDKDEDTSLSPIRSPSDKNDHFSRNGTLSPTSDLSQSNDILAKTDSPSRFQEMSNSDTGYINVVQLGSGEKHSPDLHKEINNPNIQPTPNIDSDSPILNLNGNKDKPIEQVNYEPSAVVVDQPESNEQNKINVEQKKTVPEEVTLEQNINGHLEEPLPKISSNISEQQEEISGVSESIEKDIQPTTDYQSANGTEGNLQYDQNGKPLTYDPTTDQSQYDPSQMYDESGQPIQFDEHGQPIQYDENGQIIQYDQNGQPIQYDQNGQPIQYDESGQPIQYDENGQPIQYTADGQLQYDANGQLVQYDANGQLIQYDENGQPLQYDPNSQIQYDENGQPIQYDESGQVIQYDQNGQPIQYDENGQPIQYDENGQPIQYDATGLQIQYDASGQPIQYDESGQPVQYTQEQYDPNSKVQFNEAGEPIQTKEQTSAQDVITDKGENASKANVFEMLDTDTDSLKQTSKTTNDSDFELSNT